MNALTCAREKAVSIERFIYVRCLECSVGESKQHSKQHDVTETVWPTNVLSTRPVNLQ